uniref:Uncharacterized protein n=1 Tax=Physcomitrium patens TaxID=3218 RepID=A0A2K1KQ87_PHYPA|nr:hypothetical protein PHYPA_006859 [Physcomitrium patens]
MPLGNSHRPLLVGGIRQASITPERCGTSLWIMAKSKGVFIYYIRESTIYFRPRLLQPKYSGSFCKQVKLPYSS